MGIFVISQFFVKNWPKNDDFWPKISDFLNFISWFSVRIFRRKMHQILGKCSNRPNFCYECAFLGYLQQKLPNSFWIFGVLVILWRRCVPRGFFWLKLSKKAILAYIGLHKITKTLNIQKLFSNFCVKYPKEHLYTKN